MVPMMRVCDRRQYSNNGKHHGKRTRPVRGGSEDMLPGLNPVPTPALISTRSICVSGLVLYAIGVCLVNRKLENTERLQVAALSSCGHIVSR